MSARRPIAFVLNFPSYQFFFRAVDAHREQAYHAD